MEIISQTEQLLGTTIEIKLPTQHSNLFSLCFEEIKRIERTYTRFQDNSELAALNRQVGKWVEVSDEFLGLLVRAEEFRIQTKGSFDITIKAILDDLGYDKNYSFKEKNKIISWSRQESDVEIDIERNRIKLSKEIDFGGLGKGFALDQVASIFELQRVRDYYVNGGGDIIAKSSSDPWPIILEHPDDTEVAIGKLGLVNGAIAGSSSNRRKWGTNHHLINPKTGKPATEVKAVFVIAKTATEADVYAKAVFTAGFEQGIRLSEELPIEVIIISTQNKMYRSHGFELELFE